MNDLLETSLHFQSYSRTSNGRLQLAWDSTSLGAYKTCPRLYYYQIVLGWQPARESVHLTFGILYHSALERYDHAKAQGKSHQEAEIETVRWALQATWNSKLKRPWLSDDPNKNRVTLIRTIVWYLDQFADDSIETVILASGKPAVELSFRFELPLRTANGEQYLYCGHIDRIGKFSNQTWIVDRKTTKNTIGLDYFEKYSPDNQFSGYMVGGRVTWGQPLAGLIVDAAQVAVTFSRFQRGVITRTEAQLDEWLQDTMLWIQDAERSAIQGYWRQNDKSCDMYGGCKFRGICSKSPASREEWLKRDFIQKEPWNPLKVRGDI